MDAGKTVDMINPMDYMKGFLQRISLHVIELATKSERLFKASVVEVCGWALIEAVCWVSRLAMKMFSRRP